MKRPPFTTSGFTLIDILIAIGIMGLVITALASVLSYSGRISREDNKQISLLATRQFIFKALKNYDAFQNQTVANNAAFSCADTHVACPGTNGNFILYLANGAVAYDPSNALNGFDHDGVACVSTSGNAPSASCPIRVDFSWVPICTNGCNPSSIEITVSFTTFRPPTPTSPAGTVVPSGYNFKLLKSVY